MKSILIVEDDKIVSTALSKQFERKGFTVYNAYKADAVVRMVIRDSPDCVLLDLKLPDRSGFDVIVELKRFYQGPILMLTAHNTTETEVTGFKLGADDFISKQSAFPVIYQRVVRRLNIQSEPVTSSDQISIEKLHIDKKHYMCTYQENEINFTNEEFDLLYFLVTNKNQLITRDNIYRTLKGVSYDGISRGVDIAISRIRDKLAKAGAKQQFIKSIRGKGYMFKTSDETAQAA